MNTRRITQLHTGALSLALAALLGTGCQLYYGDAFGSDSEGNSGGGEATPGIPPTPQPTDPSNPTDPSDPPFVSGSCTALPDTEVVLNCNTSAGYQVDSWTTNEDIGDTALHLVSVYETENRPFGEPRTEGEGTVFFALPGSHVLALAAYEPTHWTVNVAPGAGLDKIVLFGYHTQRVTAPADIIVENYGFEITSSGYEVCGYALPSDGQGCDTERLITDIESVTGLALSTFNGCYDASDFQLARTEPVPCDRDVVAAAAIQDCQGGPGDSWRTEPISDERLYLGTVYETRSDHSAGNHPMGAAEINFDLPGNNILALSAYEPTTWNISLSADANLEGILVFGYHEQVVDAPAGIPVEIHDYEVLNSSLAMCGYCDTSEFVAIAESLTGRTATGYDGCYHATEFAYVPATP